jgi:hypothetical protein
MAAMSRDHGDVGDPHLFPAKNIFYTKRPGNLNFTH